MLSITEFNKQWVERHEFEYDDSNFLSYKYPNILFKSIPQAWICCIFDHLSLITNLPKIISISQIFGFPVFQYENDIDDSDFKVLKNMEHDILCIDIDLHNQLEAIVFN